MEIDDELAGKVVLVTGGSRGLGLEMVRAFANRGAKVIVASRHADACETVAGQVRAEYGVEALAVGCNVSNWDDCDALVATSYAHFGRIDVLVNNAGLSPHYESLESVSEALWDKVVAVNLRGPFRLMSLIGTEMARGDGGNIINIGSIEAIRPHVNAIPYAAAKGALHILTEGFAQALAPRVRVNTIQAGPFLTDISQHWSRGLRKEIESTVALERCAEPHEIIGAVMFFATASSSFATGSVLRLDGGWP